MRKDLACIAAQSCRIHSQVMMGGKRIHDKNSAVCDEMPVEVSEGGKQRLSSTNSFKEVN